MKTCRRCKKEQDVSCFYKHKGMSDGHLNICITCKKEYAHKQRTAVKHSCLNCGKDVFTSKYRAKIGWGKYCGHSCHNKYNNVKPPVHIGENAHNWAGDKVQYHGLHDWVRRKLGTPSKCEHCGIEEEGRMYHWANKSQQYKRDLSDWLRLCVPCHAKYDNKTV